VIGNTVTDEVAGQEEGLLYEVDIILYCRLITGALSDGWIIEEAVGIFLAALLLIWKCWTDNFEMAWSPLTEGEGNC